MSSLKNLQLNWLRTFEAVGRFLSFSQAAEQLNMSQSAVSQQINLLEHRVGRKLFRRCHRTIELTVAGLAYLGVVREALQNIEHGMETIFNTLAEGVLELSANRSFVQLWLAPRLKRFTVRYPRVSIRIYSVNWEEDAPPSSAELEIRYGHGTWPGYETIELLSRRMRPYCSRSAAVALRSNVGLANVTLIDVLGTSVGWTQWVAQHRQDVKASSQRLHVDSYAIAADMAVHNVGICLMNEELVTSSPLRDVLVPAFDECVEDDCGFYLLRPREGSVSGATQAFIAWLQSERGDPQVLESVPGEQPKRRSKRGSTRASPNKS